MTSVIVIGIISVSLVAVIILYYNQFVTLHQRVNNAWSQIEVQLKRRYDLIPNLVSTVKNYASHEQSTLEKVITARSNAINTGRVSQQLGAENLLTVALENLYIVAEGYPQLKADESFRKLQEELAYTEGQISFARSFYNDTVQKYNTKISLFPNNIFAKLFKFNDAEYFNLSDTPEVRKSGGYFNG